MSMLRMIGIGIAGSIAFALVLVALSGPRGAAPETAIQASAPVYLAKDAVICPETSLFDAALSGHLKDGEAGAHAAVADLFVHPDEECTRMWSREEVRVIDSTISPTRLVQIELPALGLKYLARPSDLSN